MVLLATCRKRAAEERRVEEQRSRLLTALHPHQEQLRQGEGRPMEEREHWFHQLGEPGQGVGENEQGVEQRSSHLVNRQELYLQKAARGERGRWAGSPTPSHPRLSNPMPEVAPLNMTLATFLRGNTERTQQQADFNSGRNLVRPRWPPFYPSAEFSSVRDPLMLKLARFESTPSPPNFSFPEETQPGSYRGMHQPFDFAFNNYKNLPQPPICPNFLPPKMKAGHTDVNQASMTTPLDGLPEKKLFPKTKPHKRPSVIQNYKKVGKVQLQCNEVSSIRAKVEPKGQMSELMQGIPRNLFDEPCFEKPLSTFIRKPMDEDPKETQMIYKYLHKKFGKSFSTR